MSSRATPEPADAAQRRDARLEQFAARALELPQVLALLERFAATRLGARRLRELAPLDDQGARAALQRTEELLQLAQRGDLPGFAGVDDPLPALERARRAGRALEDEELVLLRSFLQAVERSAEWLAARADRAPRCAELAHGLPPVRALWERIDAVVDDRGRVRDGASPLLARMRREIDETARAIEGALRGLVARPEIKAVLSDPNPAQRGGRSVLAVKSKSAGRVPGIVHDRSQSDQTVFVEPREIVQLGNRQAELAADERREVERVLLELSRGLLEQRAVFDLCAERIGALELATIGARYGRESGARVPQVLVPYAPGAAGKIRGLLLRSARHPLLVEQQRLGRLAEVVPIDLRLGDEFDVLILTGPNTGGKTLALKTAGLFAALVRCGMPVPCAEGSRVPLYDGIVADIGDEQEISQSLSTFSSHLKRVEAGLARATRSTLVLLDELGGGTDPDEGAALSEAILEQFLARGAPTLVSTHIGKLKEFAFAHPRAENACVEFDARTLAPLYRILVGTPGESGALVIARRLGLPGAIVDRAHERLVRRDAELTKLMSDVRHARTSAESARMQAETVLEDVSRAQREIDEKRVELEQRGASLEAEAQRSIEERVRDARRRLEAARALLEQLPGPQRAALGAALADVDDQLSGAALSRRRQDFLDSLAKGSWVYLPRYKQRCVVQKVDKKKREISVRLGAMSVRVSFDEVTSYES